MRDPFGFISYRVGPPPHLIYQAVGWSLVFVLMITVGVRVGDQAWDVLRDALSSRFPGLQAAEPAMGSETTYDSEKRTMSETGDSTFEATPWGAAEDDRAGSGEPRGLEIPPVEAPDRPSH